MYGVDYRQLFQCTSIFVAVTALLVLIMARIKYGSFSSNVTGAYALLVHVILFYAAICIREYAGFDLLSYISTQVGIVPAVTYGDWSSAIRLQMVVSLLLMALTVIRREKWIRLAGLK